MNDPAFETNTQRKDKSPEDVDTCRICRGEGSKDEELFYPCKCSGSIKFVHQKCLMEWLSHSQKKHCELCKTPFRFTKLYDAHMPSTVPVLVFLRQATIQAWKTFLTWTRFQMVAFVWGLWLPWCMRSVWRGLFWVGDGGWVDWKRRSLPDATPSAAAFTAATTASPLTSPFSTSREELASAFVTQLFKKLPRPWNLYTRIMGGDRGDPVTFRLMKKLYYLVVGEDSGATSSTIMRNSTTMADSATRPSSWLSDVSFLKSLTRSQTMNNFLIDTLEGQALTILVVVAFIVIFLIREWVTQQQQNLLMAPEGNLNAALPPNAVVEGQENEEPQPREAGEVAIEQADNGHAAVANALPVAPPRARILAQPRRRLQRRASLPEMPETPRNGPLPEDHVEMGITMSDIWSSNKPDSTNVTEKASGASSSSQNTALDNAQRPAMPERSVIARAIEIRRTLDEHSRSSPDRNQSGAHIFKDLWSRAHEDPSEVLKLIEQEDRMGELDWIVTFMKKLEGATPALKTFAAGEVERTRQNPAQINDSSQITHTSQLESLRQKSKTRRNDAAKEIGRIQQTTAQSSHVPFGDVDHEALTPQVKEKWDSLGRQSDASSLRRRPPIPRIQSDGALAGFNLEPLDRPFGSYLSQRANTTPASDLAITGDTDMPDSHDSMPFHTPTAEDPAVAPFDNLGEGIVPTSSSHHEASLTERLVDLMWGGVLPIEEPLNAPAGDEEHIVQDIANEAPFVPVHRQQALMPPEPPQEERPEPAQDPEVVAVAAQADIDPNNAEAMDDIEDLEGVMELIGMHGPLVGLIQNAMFCALLVALTIASALWIPYMSGKVFLIMLDQPMEILKQPLRFASTSADMIVDFVIFAVGCSLYWLDIFSSLIFAPVGWLLPPLVKITSNKLLSKTARGHAERALERLASASMTNGQTMGRAFDFPQFSIVAHESLYHLEERGFALLGWIRGIVIELGELFRSESGFLHLLKSAITQTQSAFWYLTERSLALLSLAPTLLQINPLRFSLAASYRTVPLDYTLAAWSAKDRSIAIVCGYVFFALLGMLYLRLAAAIRGTNQKGRVESSLADLLYQAGGVMKVILIISIEMIVFPLYCGCLLDFALLPLFGNASLITRIQFTMASPRTSLFIHWFVGTCYMFHFALFVSMCRKLMRTGVLCKLVSTSSQLL